MRYFIALVIGFLEVVRSAPSPVQVTVLTDPSKEGFHVGPYDRTRFDLIETYNPLATATVARKSDLLKANRQPFHQRVHASGVRNVWGSDSVDKDLLESRLGQKIPLSQALGERGVVRGQYLEWGSWSPCTNGQRFRVRVCVARRAARRIHCEGPAKETQTCFSSEETNIPVAEDPWTIEREISGQMMKSRHESSA